MGVSGMNFQTGRVVAVKAEGAAWGHAAYRAGRIFRIGGLLS
jgi:hypothetical protein